MKPKNENGNQIRVELARMLSCAQDLEREGHYDLAWKMRLNANILIGNLLDLLPTPSFPASS